MLNESEQARIAHFEDLPTDDVDLNAMFPVHPDRDTILAVRRAESEEYLAKIDAETQATIAAEIAGGTTVAK